MEGKRPLTPVVCHRAGVSTPRGSRGESLSGDEECIAQRMVGGQHDANSAGVAQDRGADLEEPDTNGGGSGSRKLSAGERGVAQSLDERVGQRREHQAQPVGVELVAAGASAEEIQLGLLDTVLRFAAQAVEFVVKNLGRQIEVGYYEARVGALVAELQAGDQTALDVPGIGRIAELADDALLLASLLEGGRQTALPELHLLVQARVARDTDHIANIIALAPAQ